jgi:hypothetical protein
MNDLLNPQFEEFPKMARLSRECVITEKIDGTNACICIGPGSKVTHPLAIATWRNEAEQTDYVMLAGSRTRWITVADDNFGFARWAEANALELIKLGAGRHFGEWWGSGIQRGYGLPKGEKRFSLFNTIRWCLHGTEPKQIPCGDPRIVKVQGVLPPCVGLVPELYRGNFDTAMIEGALTLLGATGSKASPGFMNPEGIVVYHVAAGMGFKKTLADDGIPKSLVNKK